MFCNKVQTDCFNKFVEKSGLKIGEIFMKGWTNKEFTNMCK